VRTRALSTARSKSAQNLKQRPSSHLLVQGPGSLARKARHVYALFGIFLVVPFTVQLTHSPPWCYALLPMTNLRTRGHVLVNKVFLLHTWNLAPLTLDREYYSFYVACKSWVARQVIADSKVTLVAPSTYSEYACRR
jgi:hypothetical protein